MNTSSVKPLVIIPARSGSKGIPGKNLMPIAGKSMLAWAVDAAAEVVGHQWVVVSSDGEEILGEARRLGVVTHKRSNQTSSDQASSESALLEALDDLRDRGLQSATLMFMQCTSPCITPEDLAGLIELYSEKNLDSAFTATPSHAFLWRYDTDGFAAAVNHDMSIRPRRQDRVPEFRENGAAYLMNTEGFRAHKHRFFGRCSFYAMPESRSHEVDTQIDAAIVSTVLRRDGQSLGDFAPRCKAIVFDFDGVLTDNAVFVEQTGTESVRCDRRDGYGFGLAKAAGVRTLILSKERNRVVAARAEKLDCEVIHGVDEKPIVLEGWLNNNGMDWSEIAYVGNDLNDLQCIINAGLGVAVSDAFPEVLDAADLVLTRPGGHGAARELIDRLLSEQQSRKKEIG